MIILVLCVICIILLAVSSGFSTKAAVDLKGHNDTDAKNAYKYTIISSSVGWVCAVGIVVLAVVLVIYGEGLLAGPWGNLILLGFLGLCAVACAVDGALNAVALSSINKSIAAMEESISSGVKIVKGTEATNDSPAVPEHKEQLTPDDKIRIQEDIDKLKTIKTKIIVGMLLSFSAVAVIIVWQIIQLVMKNREKKKRERDMYNSKLRNAEPIAKKIVAINRRNSQFAAERQEEANFQHELVRTQREMQLEVAKEQLQSVRRGESPMMGYSPVMSSPNIQSIMRSNPSFTNMARVVSAGDLNKIASHISPGTMSSITSHAGKLASHISPSTISSITSHAGDISKLASAAKMFV